MRKFLIFSVALLTTTLLCASCQKEDAVVTSDVSTAVKSEVQASKNLHVSYKDAIQIATEAVAMLEGDAQTRSAVKRRVDLSKVKYHITPQTRSGEGGDTLYYVVNYADSAGFALVSTTRADGDPLIAVTEQGNFTPGEETGNPGFDMYISLLNDRPSPKPEGPTSPIDTTFQGFGPFYETVVMSESEVEPMLVVRWGQWYPYNEYSGHLTYPAGCVAIALAQIMSYYEYPTSFIRTYDESNSIQSLNWPAIKLYPNILQCGLNNQQSTAHLIREIGEKVGIQYGNQGSGASETTVLDSLYLFGYSTDALLNDYRLNLVTPELNNNRPVYMRGTQLDADSGHAWVVDGYYSRHEKLIEYYETSMGGDRTIMSETPISTNHLHINWGNHGKANGYYNAGVFDYDEYIRLDEGVDTLSGPAYSVSLQVITGITPN